MYIVAQQIAGGYTLGGPRSGSVETKDSDLLDGKIV